MKFIYLLFILILSISCDTSSKLTKSIPTTMQNITCPENGDCSFEVIKESKLLIKTDDFGKIYPEVVHGDKLVIKYQFKKKPKKNIADSDYTEFVYFEIDANEKQINLKDKDLQKIKMLFGRICYCKGSMGYFRVTQGELYLVNNNRNLQLRSSFKINKVPQITTLIHENIKY